MRILWVCNIMPPIVGQFLKREYSVKEGWISGMLGAILERKEIKLGICYPVSSEAKKVPGRKMTVSENACQPFSSQKKITSVNIEIPGGNNESKIITCYEFNEDVVNSHLYGGNELEEQLRNIMEDYAPDLLHIFGTEFGHSLAAAKAFGRSDKILVGLQGIISLCAKEYMAGLPEEVYRRNSFRDKLKKDGLVAQQEKFFIRGKRERELLNIVSNVTGRTEFDKKASLSMNPDLHYYHMNESMREEFYTGRWEKNSCITHSIFFSQADYPLKGFHTLIDAATILKERFPDLTIRVAGNSLVNNKTLKEKVKISAYGKYLLKKIKEAGLEKHIIFLGKLSAGEMKKEYLRCHTYVCASSLENSPNSVAEAMLLGAPVVAPITGGIPSMITHEKEGLLFETGNHCELAEDILRIWSENDKVMQMSENAIRRARESHDLKKNCDVLLEIYYTLCKGQKETV